MNNKNIKIAKKRKHTSLSRYRSLSPIRKSKKYNRGYINPFYDIDETFIFFHCKYIMNYIKQAKRNEDIKVYKRDMIFFKQYVESHKQTDSSSN